MRKSIWKNPEKKLSLKIRENQEKWIEIKIYIRKNNKKETMTCKYSMWILWEAKSLGWWKGSKKLAKVRKTRQKFLPNYDD